jgi:glutathione S-transferase
MKLYTFDVAPNPRRVKLFLQYKGISLDTETIDMMKQEQFAASFKAINPASTIPVLVLDDGSTFTEVVSICWYLESLYPQRPLFGQTPQQQAEVLGWDHAIFNEGLAAVAEILRNHSEAFKHRALPGPVDIEQIPALVERGQKRVAAFFDKLESRLAGKQFLLGDCFSLADIDAFVVIDFAGWVKLTIPEQCPQLASWYQRVKQELGE